MRLRTTVGRYAGEVRDYSMAAGLAALRSGTAEPLDAPVPVLASREDAPIVAPAADLTAGRSTDRKRSRSHGR